MTRNVCSPRLFPFLSLQGDLSCVGWRVQRQADYLTWDLGSHRHIQRMAASRGGMLSAEVVSGGVPASLFPEPAANNFSCNFNRIGFLLHSSYR